MGERDSRSEKRSPSAVPDAGEAAVSQIVQLPSQPAEGKLRASKAGVRARRNRKAARKRREALKAGKPYQQAAKPANGRARTNRKAERFDVDEGRGWLIVRAERGRYAQCAEILRSAGCPVFEARQEVRTTRDGRSTVSHLPMMRRLLFVGVDGSEFACLLTDLDYVEAVFCRGEGLWFWADHIGVQDAKPAMISPRMMQKFADNVTGHLKGEKAVEDFVEELFRIGDTVRIVDGPFASFNATVEASMPDTASLDVLVNIFGRSTPVRLAEKQVEAA